MGYSTDFSGAFEISPPLSLADHTFLTKLSETRRMKRNVGPEYGIEGEFYVEGKDWGDDNIIDGNSPPKTQPGLWNQWIPNEDGTALEWDGNEKFYAYVEWVKYLLENILIPRGYKLNGEVEWQGEERDDIGKIIIVDNIVTVKEGKVVFY